MRSLPALSTREIRVAVTTDVTPLNDPVRFAFTSPSGQPAAGDWATGAWKPTQLPTREWVAYIRVGPAGDVALPAGEYVVWVSVTDATTAPVEPVATLVVTGVIPSSTPASTRTSLVMDLLDIL